MTVVTNAAGQATAAGLTPAAAGAVQINVSAAFQGQTAIAAITQTNFATAAQAAAAAGTATSSSAGTAGGGAGAAGAGGIGLTTIGIVGGAVAAGAVVATQTDVFKKDAFVTIRGEVYATIRSGGECTVPAGGGDGSGQNTPRDQPTYTIQTRGFATSNSSHRQRFAISPPTPSFMNGGC